MGPEEVIALKQSSSMCKGFFNSEIQKNVYLPIFYKIKSRDCKHGWIFIVTWILANHYKHMPSYFKNGLKHIAQYGKIIAYIYEES